MYKKIVLAIILILITVSIAGAQNTLSMIGAIEPLRDRRNGAT